MNNNIQMARQGFSLIAVVSPVTYVYRGAGASTGEPKGPLARAVSIPVRKMPEGVALETKSCELAQIPYQEPGYDLSLVTDLDHKVIRFSDEVNAMWETTHDVHEWYDTLNALKRKALNGKPMAVIPPEVDQGVVEAMKAYNVGEVWRIKLQFRFWYPNQELGTHACSTGGFSRTSVARTLYVPRSEFSDATKAANWVKESFSKSGSFITVTQTTPDVMYIDNGPTRPVITRVTPSERVATGTGDNGKPLSVVISRDPQKMKSRVNEIKRMDLGALGKSKTPKPPPAKPQKADDKAAT